MNKPLRKLALVKLRPEIKKNMSQQPYMNDMPLVYLGEIVNMPEHGVFVGHKTGKIYSGYHISNFIELSADEV